MPLISRLPMLIVPDRVCAPVPCSTTLPLHDWVLAALMLPHTLSVPAVLIVTYASACIVRLRMLTEDEIKG